MSEKDKYLLISFMCGILKKTIKILKPKFKDIEKRLLVARDKWGMGEKQINGVKKYKLPVIK